MGYAPLPPAILTLFPPPPYGDWAVRNMQRPIPVAGGDGFALPSKPNLPDLDIQDSPDNPSFAWETASPDITDYGVGQPVDKTNSMGEMNYRVPRGLDQQGAYQFQTFNKVLNHLVTHSLARETLYNWADAQFNVGGVTYPLDYGFGPGYHGDATAAMGNPQIYMRPGIWRGAPPASAQ